MFEYVWLIPLFPLIGVVINGLFGKSIKNEKIIGGIGSAMVAIGDCYAAKGDLDVNLAKQLNILITQMGFEKDKIVTDPMSSALGYGIEYTYSVMERLRLAALQGDKWCALPMICTIDPTNSTDYMDRTIDIQNTKTFYNRLLNRAGVQLTNAHFGSFCLSNRTAIIGLDHLTFGATNYLERRVDGQVPGDWTPVTNFVSLSRTNCIVDPQDPATKAAFYRMWSTR